MFLVFRITTGAHLDSEDSVQTQGLDGWDVRLSQENKPKLEASLSGVSFHSKRLFMSSVCSYTHLCLRLRIALSLLLVKIIKLWNFQEIEGYLSQLSCFQEGAET